MENPLKRQSGFSLVEICVAVMIIAMTSFIVILFSRHSIALNQDSRGNDAAYLAAEEKLCDLAAEAFPDAGGSDSVFVDNIPCLRTWAVKDTGMIRRAIVTIQWKSLKGADRQIKLAGAIN